MKDGFEDSQIDHENPPVFADVEENKRASPLIERIRLTKPCFGVMLSSMFTNYAVMSMLVYGFTGVYRYALIAGFITMPISSVLTAWDAVVDREKWYQKQVLLRQGRFQEAHSMKTVFDWSGYEAEIARTLKNR
ncbi:unnamed protein product [Enterobius vermicularis]|uniref:Microsomal signal peptidase 25 kDa subunit n=1 Tax=Enterobius vermicularis TaxID=51028 RepID=A0A0N4UZT2_ENTVE|nr:unnamed protein product [Enterobius vermicularis]